LKNGNLKALITGLLCAISLSHAQSSLVAKDSDVKSLLPNKFTFGQSERQKRLDELRAGLSDKANQVIEQSDKPGAKITVRDLCNTALYQLASGAGDASTAEKLLRLEFENQNNDKSSDTYGRLPWDIGSQEISDLNANEFGTQAVGPILLGYGSSLSEECKKWLRPHIEASFTAMRNHNVPISYTNIYLMKAINMILLGAAIQDQAAQSEGEANLDKWIQYTQNFGIHEFDSPTYYACDLNSLLMGYIYAPSESVKVKIKACLDYFWNDIAANYFPGDQSLSGAHSRDYDFLRGGGGLDVFTYLEGLRSKQHLHGVDMEKVYPLVNGLNKNAYHPGSSILQTALVPIREVKQRWDEEQTKDRYNFITEHYSLSYANGNYGPQDKLIAMQFASSKELPTISVIPDTSDKPYGKNPEKDKSGHRKPHHVPLTPSIVQYRGTLLALLNLDSSKLRKINSYVSFATNVIIPAQADVVILDGKQVDLSTPQELKARVGSVVGVMEAGTAMIVKVFQADACDGGQAQVLLKADREGIKNGAGRLAIYHSVGQPDQLTNKHVKVGLLMVASQNCDSKDKLLDLARQVAHFPIDQSLEGDLWKVRATAPDCQLGIVSDIKARSTRERTVNGKELRPEVFTVNGEAVSTWRGF
jgi:hypothetical protein